MLIAASTLGLLLPFPLFSLNARSSALGNNVTGVKGHGLRALSSGALLVSSLGPISFPLRYKHRKKQTTCYKKFKDIIYKSFHNQVKVSMRFKSPFQRVICPEKKIKKCF